MSAFPKFCLLSSLMAGAIVNSGCANKLEPAPNVESSQSNQNAPNKQPNSRATTNNVDAGISNSSKGEKSKGIDSGSTNANKIASKDSKFVDGKPASRKSEVPEGLILPQPDEGPSINSNRNQELQSSTKTDNGIVGKTYCAKEELKVSDSPQLAIKTEDMKIYLIDISDEQFTKFFDQRKDRLTIRVSGPAYKKDGVFHLTAKDVSLIR